MRAYLLNRCSGRYRNTCNASFFDGFSNEPGGFHLFDEFSQIPGSSGAAFDNTEGLLNCHKPAVEHPRFGKLLRVGNEMLSDAGEDVHFTREDQFERSVRIRRANQFGMLNSATQKQIVSTARRDTHPHALAVDVFDSPNRRSRRHEVSTFDLYIRSREINLVCPARIDRQECHVPSTVLHGIEHFASRIESDKLHRPVDALAKLLRQINGHAAESAAWIFSRKYRVAIIDANAQLASRCEIRKHSSRDWFGHW